MNQETSTYLYHVEEYLKRATEELAKARKTETGSRVEALHISEAKFKIQEALTVIGRVLPPSP